MSQDDYLDIDVKLFPLTGKIYERGGIRVDTKIYIREEEGVDLGISYAITDQGGRQLYQTTETRAVKKIAFVTA